MLKFSRAEKLIGEKMRQKFIELRERPGATVISFDELYGCLDRDEIILIDKICSANPKEYGKNFTVFYGINPVPKKMIEFSGQKYVSARDGKTKTVRTQYLPEAAGRQFLKMKAAMQKDLGTAINVTSGYRSPAYQAVVIFLILLEKKWSMKNTLRCVTLPGCSEHGHPPRQGMDLAPVAGIETIDEFYKTAEYQWLDKNAARFGLELSYPPNNKFGVMFEPYHWRYVKN